MYCPTMDSQQVHSQPLYDDSQMLPNSSVVDDTESIPLRGGFATSTQNDPGVSQPFHTFHFTTKLCTTGVPFEKQSEPSTCEASPSSSGNQERICDSSEEESSDQEKAGDKSGITTSSEHDEASGQNSKGDSERLISLIFNNNEYINY
jgi:hypothetical protein